MDSSTSLHAFGDIVGYSRLNAVQQAQSQERFARILDNSLRDAGVSPDSILKQDQGDARLLTFPVGTDVARVLAAMPRHFNDELEAHNRDAAPHARLRVRLSYVMGPAAVGVTGQAGNATIAVVRLSSDRALRQAMKAMQDAYLGMIVDDYLYSQYIRQEFRPDLSPDEYIATHVSDREKDFEADAWIRLVGHPKEAWESLIDPMASSVDGQNGRIGAAAARHLVDAVQPVRPDPAEAQTAQAGEPGNRHRSEQSAPDAKSDPKDTIAFITAVAAVITVAVNLGAYFATPGSSLARSIAYSIITILAVAANQLFGKRKSPVVPVTAVAIAVAASATGASIYGLTHAGHPVKQSSSIARVTSPSIHIENPPPSAPGNIPAQVACRQEISGTARIPGNDVIVVAYRKADDADWWYFKPKVIHWRGNAWNVTVYFGTLGDAGKLFRLAVFAMPGSWEGYVDALYATINPKAGGGWVYRELPPSPAALATEIVRRSAVKSGC